MVFFCFFCWRFSLLRFITTGAGVLEPADLLCSRLFEIVFDDLYSIDLGRFAHMLVHVVQHGLLLGLEVFEELVLCSLV